MKRIFRNIAFALALPLLAVGCTTDYPEPDQGGLPQASELIPRIEIDQETNYVTLSVDNKGVVPMWIFGEEKVDGKPAKKYAYAQNGIKLRIREAGVHQVELKAYNVNGVSMGSKMVEFTMDNDYRDPFDPEPYMKALSNGSSQDWMWNSTVDGHFGCGSTGSDGLDWWSAKAGEKADWSLYDDRLTFTIDGEYTYDPVDGQVYVNKDSGYKPEYNLGDGNDYMAPIEKFTTTYTIENAWNDAGIEEIYLVLPANTNLSYIPNPTGYAEPRFRFIETSAGSIKKTMKLVIDTPTENGGGGIAWHYEFVPYKEIVEGAVTFDGVEFAGGMVETSLTQGGDIAVEGIELDKAWIDPDFFTLVDAKTLRFNAASGDYRVIWDGKWFKVLPLKNGETATYDNAGALWIIGDGGGKPDVNNLIGWVTENALPCARIDENTYRITLYMKAEGGSVKVFGQANWGVEWTKDKYGAVEDNGFFNIPDADGNIKTIEGSATPGYYTFTFVDNGGILDMSVVKAKVGDTTIYDPTAPENMWLSMTVNSMFYYYAPGWAQIADPELVQNGSNDYTVTLPEATSDQWQAQMAFKTTMSSSADKRYDFYLVMTSTEDHPGVTVKLVKEGDDETFYFADRHPLKAYEEFVYKVPDMAGIDMASINLFFDFGGNVAGTEINIKDILFQEHREE